MGQNLGQIRPCEKSKETCIINRFFLHGEYLLKKKSVVVDTPEWKFKANIAKNSTFGGRLGPHFGPIRVKLDKKLIIFKNFTLVSQS